MPAPTDLTEALAATYRDALARLSGGCDWTSLATDVTALMPPLYRRVLVTLAEGFTGARCYVLNEAWTSLTGMVAYGILHAP